MKRLAFFTCALTLLGAGSATAAQRVVRADVFGAPALAGGQVAYVDVPPGGGTYAVRLAAPGSAARTLASGEADAQDRFGIAASASRLGFDRVDVSGGAAAYSFQTAPLAGGFTTLGACSGAPGRYSPPFSGVSGDLLAWTQLSCGSPARLVVRSLGGGPDRTVDQPAGTTIGAVRVADPYVAYLRQGPGSDALIVVLNRVTGLPAYNVSAPAARLPVEFDVQSNGTLAASFRGRGGECDRVLAWYSPSAPKPHTLPGGVCRGGVRIHGDTVVSAYRDSEHRELLAATDLAGRSRNVASLGIGGTRIGGFDADEDQVAYTLRNCQGRPTIWTESLSASAGRLQSEACPVKFVSGRAPVDRRLRAATVRIRCRRGCAGFIELERTRRRFRTEMVGRTRVSFPASRRTRRVKIRLRRGAKRALRRRRSFIVGGFAEVRYRSNERVLPEEFRALRLSRPARRR